VKARKERRLPADQAQTLTVCGQAQKLGYICRSVGVMRNAPEALFDPITGEAVQLRDALRRKSEHETSAKSDKAAQNNETEKGTSECVKNAESSSNLDF
jgi:hypothetical protein